MIKLFFVVPINIWQCIYKHQHHKVIKCFYNSIYLQKLNVVGFPYWHQLFITDGTFLDNSFVANQEEKVGESTWSCRLQ